MEPHFDWAPPPPPTGGLELPWHGADLRARFWDRYYFYYSLMTYIMLFHVPDVYFRQYMFILYFSNKLSSLETYMNHDLEKFSVWAMHKKLTVVPSKSHAVIISSKCNNNMNSFNDISLNYGKTKILIKNCCKYLGIIVDSNLNLHSI